MTPMMMRMMRNPNRRGFTLVEILVSITIIIVLAGIIVTITGMIRERAKAAGRLSNIRQSGIVLLGMAAEANGKCSYFAGGSGGFDLRHYILIRDALGIRGSGNLICEIMHWDPVLLVPQSSHWTCTAVNFNNVEEFEAVWKQESVLDPQGRKSNVKSIAVAAVKRPASYPLLVDSSAANGNEIFRINESGGDYVGLRNSGKANAFMFDGSARTMDKADLKKSGFTKAWDNSTTPPTKIDL